MNLMNSMFMKHIKISEVLILIDVATEQKAPHRRKFDKKVLGRWPIISASKIGGRYRLLKKIGIC